MIPVAFERAATSIAREQAIRFDKYTGNPLAKGAQLVPELTLELCSSRPPETPAAAQSSGNRSCCLRCQ